MEDLLGTFADAVGFGEAITGWEHDFGFDNNIAASIPTINEADREYPTNSLQLVHKLGAEGRIEPVGELFGAAAENSAAVPDQE